MSQHSRHYSHIHHDEDSDYFPHHNPDDSDDKYHAIKEEHGKCTRCDEFITGSVYFWHGNPYDKTCFHRMIDTFLNKMKKGVIAK
jgi:hypothetical protein